MDKMKKILALVLAAIMMMSVVAFAEPSITIDDTVTVDNPAAMEVIVDAEGIVAVVAAYEGEGEVVDAIAVIALQEEPVTLTFTLAAAFESDVTAIAVAGEYSEELDTTVNADGSVTVTFTAEAMAALANGGYLLFVAK